MKVHKQQFFSLKKPKIRLKTSPTEKNLKFTNVSGGWERFFSKSDVLFWGASEVSFPCGEKGGGLPFWWA